MPHALRKLKSNQKLSLRKPQYHREATHTLPGSLVYGACRTWQARSFRFHYEEGYRPNGICRHLHLHSSPNMPISQVEFAFRQDVNNLLCFLRFHQNLHRNQDDLKLCFSHQSASELRGKLFAMTQRVTWRTAESTMLGKNRQTSVPCKPARLRSVSPSACPQHRLVAASELGNETSLFRTIKGTTG